jgi:hypothetical protein
LECTRCLHAHGRRLARFEVEPFSSPFQPEVDPGRLNQLSDELEIDECASRVARSTRRG